MFSPANLSQGYFLTPRHASAQSQLHWEQLIRSKFGLAFCAKSFKIWSDRVDYEFGVVLAYWKWITNDFVFLSYVFLY